MSKEAMRLALEALEICAVRQEHLWHGLQKLSMAKNALQAALAQQPAQQEPVYWQWRRTDQPWSLEYTFSSEVQVTTKDSERRALYISPPAQRTWVGLTDEDIDQCLRVSDGSMGRLLSTIEAKLKEKNT